MALGFTLGSLVDNQRSQVVAGGLVVLGVAAVAQGKLFTLPASTKGCLEGKEAGKEVSLDVTLQNNCL
jgi:hypothetical protein